MKVRCSLCGKIFPSENEYLDGNHDKRLHAYADMQSFAVPLIPQAKPAVPVKDVDAVR